MKLNTRVTPNPRITEIHRLFELTQEAADDAVARVDVRFRRHELALFSTEGSSGGNRWAPLSPRYKKRKDRLFSGATAEVQRVARGRTGRALRGSRLRKALGASNKILQLTGDMHRAFTSKGGSHIAHAYRGRKGWVIALGAQGPGWWEAHAKGRGRIKQRNPMQHEESQWREYLTDISRAFIPHVMRRVKIMAAWPGARGL